MADPEKYDPYVPSETPYEPPIAPYEPGEEPYDGGGGDGGGQQPVTPSEPAKPQEPTVQVVVTTPEGTAIAEVPVSVQQQQGLAIATAQQIADNERQGGIEQPKQEAPIIEPPPTPKVESFDISQRIAELDKEAADAREMASRASTRPFEEETAQPIPIERLQREAESAQAKADLLRQYQDAGVDVPVQVRTLVDPKLSPFVQVTAQGQVYLKDITIAEKAGVNLRDFEKLGFSSESINQQKGIEIFYKTYTQLPDGQFLDKATLLKYEKDYPEVYKELITKGIGAANNYISLQNEKYGASYTIKVQPIPPEVLLKDAFKGIVPISGFVSDKFTAPFQIPPTLRTSPNDLVILGYDLVNNSFLIKGIPKPPQGFAGFDPVITRTITSGSKYAATFDLKGEKYEIWFDSEEAAREYDKNAPQLPKIMKEIGGGIESILTQGVGYKDYLNSPEFQLASLGVLSGVTAPTVAGIKYAQPVIRTTFATLGAAEIYNTYQNRSAYKDKPAELALSYGLGALMFIPIDKVVSPAFKLVSSPNAVSVEKATLARTLDNINQDLTDLLVARGANPKVISSVTDSYLTATKNFANADLTKNQLQKVINDIGFARNQGELQILKDAQARLDILNGIVPNLEGVSDYTKQALNDIKPLRDLEKNAVNATREYVREINPYLHGENADSINKFMRLPEDVVDSIKGTNQYIVSPRNTQSIISELDRVNNELSTTYNTIYDITKSGKDADRTIRAGLQKTAYDLDIEKKQLERELRVAQSFSGGEKITELSDLLATTERIYPEETLGSGGTATRPRISPETRISPSLAAELKAKGIRLPTGITTGGGGSTPFELTKPLSKQREEFERQQEEAQQIAVGIPIPSSSPTPSEFAFPSPQPTPSPSPMPSPTPTPIPPAVPEPLPPTVPEPIPPAIPTPVPPPVPTPTPTPVPPAVPTPVPPPVPEPTPIPVPPVVPIPTPTPVPPITPPIPPKPPPPMLLPSEEIGGGVFKKGVPRGTIEWRQGMKWEAVPPPYDRIYHLDNPLPGTYKFAVGKGSAYKTLQVLGGAPQEDVDLDVGWAQIHIDAKTKDLKMTFGGGQEAANERWAAEREAMDELQRESYAETPQGEITQRIPRSVAKRFAPIGLQKVEIPQYQSGKIKVYLVNGEYVRSEMSKENPELIDFTMDGHWLKYKSLPKNELWIERGMSIGDKKATLVHALPEIRAMEQGIPYKIAHPEYGNVAEMEVRHNPEKLDELLEEEVEPPRRMKVYNRSRSVIRRQEETYPSLPTRYYLGRRLRSADLGVRI